MPFPVKIVWPEKSNIAWKRTELNWSFKCDVSHLGRSPRCNKKPGKIQATDCIAIPLHWTPMPRLCVCSLHEQTNACMHFFLLFFLFSIGRWMDGSPQNTTTPAQRAHLSQHFCVCSKKYYTTNGTPDSNLNEREFCWCLLKNAEELFAVI